MFTLRVSNTSTYIDGVPSEYGLDEEAQKPIKDFKKALREAVGFRDENAVFRAMNMPGYDGLIHTLCHGYGPMPCKCGLKKKGMHFPSGLIGRVTNFFKEQGHVYRVVDQRQPVTAVKGFSLSPEMESRDYQIGIVDKAIQWNRGIVKLATGGGKCQQETDICLTSDGMLMMGELGEGLSPQQYRPLRKQVASPLTQTRREITSEMYRDGVGPSRRYRTCMGFTSAATPKHRIKVLEADGDIRWKYVSELAEGDVTVLCKGQKLFGSDTRLSLGDAYWWGLLHGDGGCTKRGQLKFTNCDDHLVGFVEGYLQDRGLPLINRQHRTSVVTRELEINSTAYRTALADMGMKYAKAIHKDIPRIVRSSPKESVAMFLRGLFETDGWVGREANKPTICIGLSSERFIDQLHVILLNFGIVASRRVKETTHEDSHILTVYRDYIPTFMSEIGFDPAGHKHAKITAAMEAVEGLAQNSNTDVVPNQSAKLRRLRTIIKSLYGYYGTKSLVEESGVKWNTFRSWADACAWREPSRRSLVQFLKWAEVLLSGVSTDSRVVAYDESLVREAESLVSGMKWLCDDQFFYDRIESIEETVTDNYDFVVPDTHSFVAQGFINHNTGTAARLIAQLGVVPFIFFVPSKDLLEQAAREFERFILRDGRPVKVGRVGGGHRTIGDITVMTIQTARLALDENAYREAVANAALAEERKAERERIAAELQARLEAKLAERRKKEAEKARLQAERVAQGLKPLKKYEPGVYKDNLEARVARKLKPADFDDPARDEDDEIDGTEEFEDLGEFRTAVRELVHNCKGFIADEVQHWASKTCQLISDHAYQARYRYGFSATPKRDMGDDMLIDACFGGTICDINASFLIDHEQKFLVQPTIYFVPVDNYKRVKFEAYQDAYAAAIIENPTRNQYIANIAKKLSANGRMVLILVKSIAHGEILEEMLKEQGAVFVHGSHSGEVREKHIQAMKDGKAPITIASTIFDEGIDVRPLDAVIQAGGGKSQTRALQRIGRAIRPYKYPNGTWKKDAIIIDFYDDVKWLRTHSNKRRLIYSTEPKFIIKDLKLAA